MLREKIEQDWQDFARDLIPKEAGKGQLLAMRSAFLGGLLVFTKYMDQYPREVYFQTIDDLVIENIKKLQEYKRGQDRKREH